MNKNVFERNVVVSVFKVESEGYQALSDLKYAAVGDTYCVYGAALVKKEGKTTYVLDVFETGAKAMSDTAKGGLIGMLAGILGGPIGMLIGAGYGSLVGANMGAADVLYEASMLEQIAGKLDDGMVAVVVAADEETPDALDAFFSQFDTIIARFDAEAVADEVDRACEMEAEMARQARMELRREMKEERKAKFEDNVDKAHEKFEENTEILRHNFTK